MVFMVSGNGRHLFSLHGQCETEDNDACNQIVFVQDSNTGLNESRKNIYIHVLGVVIIIDYSVNVCFFFFVRDFVLLRIHVVCVFV